MYRVKIMYGGETLSVLAFAVVSFGSNPSLQLSQDLSTFLLVFLLCVCRRYSLSMRAHKWGRVELNKTT
jgi:hypothetical protein